MSTMALAMEKLKSRAGAAALALAAAVVPHAVLAANNDPIVLVHGFLGFGPNELRGTGFKYWGGFHDVQAHMQGYDGTPRKVMTAAVGPVSSNWDRAVELYYQIKGGCVDYGAAHTAQFASFGAIRMPTHKCWAADAANNPNNYPLALYPSWDAAHPLHLISHSQGGQTIRVLIELLENGSPNGDEGGGTLFAGGKVGWVKSATSISSPHNGTTLRDVVINYVPKISELAGKLVEVAGLGGSANPGYNFKLEQYGLAQGPSENFRDFLNRVNGAAFWSLNHKNSAQWDLGPDGARELNNWVKTSPNVFYYSIANVATEQGSFCCNGTDRIIAPFQSSAYQYARDDMIFFLKNTAGEWVVPSILVRGMGSYTQASSGRVAVDSRWFPNDGVVNTISMRAPSGQSARNYDGNNVRGTWQHLGYYPRYDHFDVLGWLLPASAVYPIYDHLSGLLYSL
jgi:triacylglycerol lipase